MSNNDIGLFCDSSIKMGQLEDAALACRALGLDFQFNSLSQQITDWVMAMTREEAKKRTLDKMWALMG
jgi:hypothetical protein